VGHELPKNGEMGIKVFPQSEHNPPLGTKQELDTRESIAGRCEAMWGGGYLAKRKNGRFQGDVEKNVLFGEGV